MEIGNNVGIADFILGKLLICAGPVRGAFRALHALVGGGDWGGGVRCGGRGVSCCDCPWDVYAGVGVRCVCDFTIL